MKDICVSKVLYIDTKEELLSCKGHDGLIVVCNPFLLNLARESSLNAVDLFEFWSQDEMNAFSLECWRFSNQIIKVAKGYLTQEKNKEFSFNASQDQSLYRYLHSYLFFHLIQR